MVGEMPLTLRSLFNSKVHSSSVTSLAVGEPGADLFCGIKVQPSQQREESSPSLLQVDAKDGKVVCRFAAPGPASLSSLWIDSSTNIAACCFSDGVIRRLHPIHGLEQELTLGLAQNPDKQIGSRHRGHQGASSQPSLSHTETGAEQSLLPPPPSGPQFYRSQGYRGPRDGYFYREGTLGKGYYRRDVVRQYAAGEGAGASAGSESTLNADCAASQLPQSSKGIRCCAPSPDPCWVASAPSDPDDASVMVWRCAEIDGKKVARPAAILQGHSAAVLCLSWSPDGSLLFTGSYDHTVRVWSADTWRCTQVLQGHGGGVRAIAAASDGLSLYTTAADNTVRAWSTRRWVCLRLMHGRHEETTWPACMALTEGRGPQTLLATGSTGPFGGSTIKVFSPGTGECLASVQHLGPEQRGGVTALVFAGDGKVLYSAGSDGTVAAWALDWAEESGHGRQGAAATMRRGFLG